jgi:hypothetical protein
VQCFFFWARNFAKGRKIIISGNILSQYLLFLQKKISPNFRKNKIGKIWSHLDFDLSLRAFISLAFKKIKLRQVLKSCCHLMLNPSLDASQCCNILKIEENITDYCVSWDFFNFLFSRCTLWHTNKMNFIVRGKKRTQVNWEH